MIDRGGFDRIDANLQKEVYLTRSCIFNRPFECVVECYFNGVTHSGFERTKKIYQDPEFKGRNEEGNKIKKFLEESKVYVELVLIKDLDNESAERIIIGRNFLARNKKIQEINNEQITNKKDFSKKLAELMLGSSLRKPSFRQVICRNVRYSWSSKLLSVNSHLSYQIHPYQSIQKLIITQRQVSLRTLPFI